MIAPGTRVWAVQKTDDTTVRAYGFGTYVGDRLLDGWDRPVALERAAHAIRRSDASGPIFDPETYYATKVAAGRMTRKQADTALERSRNSMAAERARPFDERVRNLAKAIGANPYIELDNGGYVWGAECWWGPVADDDPQPWVKGRRLILVPAPTRDGEPQKNTQEPCDTCAANGCAECHDDTVGADHG